MKALIKAIVDLTIALREHSASLDHHSEALAENSFQMDISRP